MVNGGCLTVGQAPTKYHLTLTQNIVSRKSYGQLLRQNLLLIAGVLGLGVVGLGLGAVVAGAWNLTVVAPVSVFKFGHVVLKWLHHLEE